MCVGIRAFVDSSMNPCFAKIPEILCLDELMEDSLELGCPYEGVYSVDWPWVKVNVLTESTLLA
jgi:hypothetical protein